MTDPLRWGILGAGGIAASFVEDLSLLAGADVVAVGSRAQQSADAFADRFAIAHRHASYEALVADPDVDVVYVATPHPYHFPATMLAISAGKNVLCEKPFMLNAAQAEEVVAAARSAGVFCMEAMWTRFLPHVVRIRELLASGSLGDVWLVMADFGVRFDVDPAHRVFDPALGGGALLDLGVYPLSFASMCLGAPVEVHAVASTSVTGVDAWTSVVLGYDEGRQALVNTTLAADGPTRAAIVGTEGRIEVDRHFFTPSTFTLIARDDAVVERFDQPHEGGGLRHQAAEVARCLREGRLESGVMPLDETISIMRTLDEVRRQIGLVYPQER